MKLFSLPRGQLAFWLGDWLMGAVGESSASPPPAGFYALPGQDPFAHTTPQAALADLYWESPRNRQIKLSCALLDLAARPERLLPLGALEVLARTCGAIKDPDLLMPLIRTIGARGDLGSEAVPVYSTLVSVAAGFGPCEQTWDAARELAGLKFCPDKLAFDVFDLGLADHREAWHEWFRRLEPAMLKTCGLKRVHAVRKRLRHTAEQIAEAMAIGRIESGLRALVGDHALAWPESEWLESEDPRGMLVAALIAGPTRHFQVLMADGKPSLRRSMQPEPALSAITADRGTEAQAPSTTAMARIKPIAAAFSRLDVDDEQDLTV